MNCLQVNITKITEPLTVTIKDIVTHPRVNTSLVCGIDLSWEGISDEEGTSLYDSSGDNLLIKKQE